MEQKQPSAPAEIEEQLQGLAPLNIIRTETVISKLPIHNLAKNGAIDIRIVRKNAKGEVTLSWEVSPSRNYGDPRALAYKLDTLVVNRKIEEQGRPIPKLIRLGSLRHIGQQIGITDNTARIKNALHQNAGAYITAKLTYTANDGTQKTLETGFTRYSVVFTGDRLPDGQVADAVYLTLNDPYRDVLNSAPVRPLNYDYLRELPPAAQRFYEVVSRQIFAALKHRRAEARLPYSEYCAYSAQLRYFDYDRFKKQMYKVHRPHLVSGYLKAVRFERAMDGEGKMDWNMYYTPGPKARAEYNAFTRSGRMAEMAIDADREDVVIAAPSPAKARRIGPGRKRPGVSAPEGAGVEHPAAAGMLQRGISGRQAKELLAGAKDPEFILDQLEWGDEQLRRARPGSIRNPAGFFVHLIRERIPPQPGFETSRMRRLREEAHNTKQAEVYERLLLEQDYAKYAAEAVETFVAARNLYAEVEALAQEHAKGVRTQWPGLPVATVEGIAERKAWEVVKERMGPALMTFAAFCRHAGPR